MVVFAAATPTLTSLGNVVVWFSFSVCVWWPSLYMQTFAAEIYCEPQVKSSTIIPNSLKKKENLHVPEQLSLLLEKETSSFMLICSRPSLHLVYVSR